MEYAKNKYFLKNPVSEAVARWCSVKKVFLEISQNLQENTCVRVFFNKVAGLRPATLLKKSLWHRCFPVNFAKFLRKPFFKEHLRWLILQFKSNMYESFIELIHKLSMCFFLPCILTYVQSSNKHHWIKFKICSKSNINVPQNEANHVFIVSLLFSSNKFPAVILV